MSKLITRIKRLALALCFVTPLVSWAADAPTITIDGTTVTINNETASSYDSTKTLPVTDAWQTKGFWLPTGTGLASGTMVKVKSIAFAVPSTGNFVDKIGLAGCVSASAVRTTGGFTTANADKVLFSFEDSQCYLRAGYSSQIWFLDSTGAKVATSTVLNFTIGGNSNQYIDNLGWTINSVFHTPVIEVVGEILPGSYITGALTAIGNSGTDPVYASGVTGWLDTANSKTGPMVLVGSNSGAYSIGINNANSVNAAGQHSTWSKLSGSGTLGAVNGQSTGTYPVLEVYDASEFTGSIVTANGGPNLSVVFCTSDESDTLKTSYFNWFYYAKPYVNSLYISAASDVTVPAGKTWQASKLVVAGQATINGSFSGQIVRLDGGTVTVNAGATISGFGAIRDFTGVTVDPSVAVKVTMTSEEYGKGSVSVTGANGISTITVLAPDGTTEVGTITPEAGAGTLETSVQTSGLATWCDYEFNGDKSNSGVNKTGLTSDVDTNDYPEIFNNQMLYTYTHPYRGITYPDSWTAVVRCTVPELENAVVVMFGTYAAGAIGLVAGSNPEEEMLLVSTPGAVEQAEDKHFTTLATMNVKDATTAQHVYVFTKDGTTVNVYCDGEKVLENYELASATLGGGLQIGSLHGGVVQSGVHTGLVRFGAGESQISTLTLAQQQNARIDCMRMYDYIVSPEQVAALSVEFPAVKLYRATVADGATTDWDLLTWTPGWDGGNTQSKVILTTEGDAAVALPASITVDEVQLDLAEGSTLTLTGPGELAITQPITIEDGTLELTGTVTLTQDTAFNGAVTFTEFTKAGDGDIQLSNGATVGVDAALVVTPLGTYTCAEGTVVDSAYEGDGVKLMPLTSAVVSITQSGTTLYYSDLDTALGPLVNAPGTISDDVVVTLLNGTTLPFGYDTFLLTAGYYIDGGVITKAVARIGTTTYPTLAAAVSAAADGATVTLLRASSEEIALNDKAITLSETANFSGTLTGNGTLTFAAFRNNPSITFDNWTGTVVLPEFEAGGTILNKYGVTGSTVVLKGITGGWLGETGTQKMDVDPVLQLDGDVIIKGFSTSWDYTFAEITGDGNFALDPTDNSPKSATITTVAEDFTGIITNNTTVTLTIGTLERADGTSTAVDQKLLDVSGDVVAEALTVAGEPVDVRLETREDGIYVGAPYVAYVGETPYTSLADAVADATDGDTVELVADVELTARVEPNVGAETEITIDLGGFTITRTGTSGNGSVFDVKSGTVTIKNGTIDCTQDDTAIAKDGVYAITARSGSVVTLETLDITVNSECGACAYPFAGSTMTIKSGTYKNTTTTPYRYKTAWTGMAVNQENVTDKLLTIEGGRFSQVNPEEGDDSGKVTNFLADGRIAKLQDGYWVVQAGTWVAEIDGTKYDSLATAIGAAQAGDTVTLLVNTDGVVGANANDITLDLAGCTITGGDAIKWTGTGKLTIVDSVGGGKAIGTAADGCALWVTGGSVEVQAGYFQNNSEEEATVYVNGEGATVTITGGTFRNQTQNYKWGGSDFDYYSLNVGNSRPATSIQVSGGSFSHDPAKGDDKLGSLLASGYQSTYNELTALWVVTEVPPAIDPTDPTSAQEVTVETEGKSEAEIKEAAIAASTVEIPETVATQTSVTEETYKGYFTYTVTETATEGVYEVAIAGLNEEAVFPTSEAEELTAELADVLDADTGDGVAITTAKPGLYYSIEAAENVGFTSGKVEGARELATTGTVSPKKPAKTGTAVFYRVKVSVTPDSVTP